MTTPVLELPPLLSCTETHNERICQGWNSDGCVNAGDVEGGDEKEPRSDLCKADREAEDEHYRKLALKQQEEEDVLDSSQYVYLRSSKQGDVNYDE